jgi:hypothetical protein
MAVVKLISESSIEPEALGSHAGRVCYNSIMPELGAAKLDVQKRLWKPGHHTTLEHWHGTFDIDDIAVSSCTFGIHLDNPFYDSDQRSGRFSAMYDNPDTSEAKQRIKKYFPDADTAAVFDMIDYGVKIFHDNKNRLTPLAADAIKRERPNASEKYIEANASKIAQEQLRAFISTAASTGLVYTADLITIAALDKVAWMPELRDIVNQMSSAVLERHPEIGYMFGMKGGRDVSFSNAGAGGRVVYSPRCEIKNVDIPELDFAPALPTRDLAIDTLGFDPACMKNNVYTIRSEVEMSVMSLAQDQRHRTLSRTMPKFTENFYAAPLLKTAGLCEAALEMRKKWSRVLHESPEIAAFAAPYGAMVKYQKMGNINGILHEQEKRLCWCAQEEIYNLNRQFATQLYDMGYRNLAHNFKPPCGRSGICMEAGRCCGRDQSVWGCGILAGFGQRNI